MSAPPFRLETPFRLFNEFHIQAEIVAGIGAARPVLIGNVCQIITVAADAGTGVTLRAARAGDICFLANDGQNSALIFCASTIDGQDASGGIALVADRRTILWCVKDGNWIGIAAQGPLAVN